MKRIFRLLLLGAVAMTAACAPREQTLVLLSTNDMHAKIQNFPRLAAAVEACRDTAQMVVLVDAGDRWTGNAYVDMAPTPGMPIITLMNRLGYDVATLGNHEFDNGQALLGRLIDSMEFEVVCANVQSDTLTFPQLPPYVVVDREGLRIGFVGVVTNYEGPGHPAGNEASFRGLTFPDPQQAAADYAAELRPKCDLLVLLSHMGDGRDMELLAKGAPYDLVIGGHTHKRIDTLINGALLTQSEKDLKNIGVTTVRFRGKKITGIDYRIVPLANYTPDPAYQQQVDTYYADPTLNRSVGEFSRTADKWGLANWMARAVADEADAQIGMYHIGGVRLDSIPAGGVSTARIFDLDPFGSQIARMRMTPADLRRMIIDKYNDPMNTKEAHRIDLITTTPYVIVTDAKDNALDVLFPVLREGQSYTIGLCDYIFRNYKAMDYIDGELLDELVTDELLDELEDDSPITPDNTPRQSVRRK